MPPTRKARRAPALPRLAGAWIEASRRVGDRLELEIEELRRWGLAYAGVVTFTGVTGVEVTSARPMNLRGSELLQRQRIKASRHEAGVTQLETREQSGPGEVDEFCFTIRHAGVEVRLRPSLRGTLRRWTGF